MTDIAAAPLRFAINLGNGVLANVNEHGQPGGITVALANRIAASLRRKPEFVTYPAAGEVVEDAGKGVWDIAFLAVDPKREAVLRFTSPYITIQGTLLVRQNSNWQSVAEMDKPGVVINVGKNAAYDLWLTREIHAATLIRHASSRTAIDAFLDGAGEMAAGIRQPLEKTARENPDFRVLPDDFTGIRQAICVAKNDSRYFASLISLLARWQQDGELKALLDEHLMQR
ncbi:transporter substrate-binding domain-containing protein [Yokenella regensburgei]|uniref:transporter substrate-binding domain-containing protein n=1 Tax=Yokenella regensburgei TaxID=158877 RepID=UPI003F148831